MQNLREPLKIVTITGTRPQFVKTAAVSRIIAKHNEIQEILIHTGQHYDENMSDIFFQQMEIPKPHYNLEVNRLTHGAMTGRMLEKIEEVLLQEKPQLVMVYGDTNSTLAGTLAAQKLHIKIAHIEAGLRSFNTKMPEEINRILTDRISDFLFCPTEQAVQNLENEGYRQFGCKIFKCGDVMMDAALFYSQKSAGISNIIPTLQQKSSIKKSQSFILCTMHRPENTDHPERLSSILTAMIEIAKKTPIVFPIHPRTQLKIKEIDSNFLLNENNIFFIPPVSYFDMLELLKHCEFVMTDSGGLQKEAYFFKKYCVTMRDETEWVELVEAGKNFVTGAVTQKIVEVVEKMPTQFIDTETPLYGDGRASETIIAEILNNFNKPQN